MDDDHTTSPQKRAGRPYTVFDPAKNVLNDSVPEEIVELLPYFSQREIDRARQRRAFRINAARVREELHNRGITLTFLAEQLGRPGYYFQSILSTSGFRTGSTPIGPLRDLLKRLELEEKPHMGKHVRRSKKKPS